MNNGHLQRLKAKALEILENKSEVKAEDKNSTGTYSQIHFKKTDLQIRFKFTRSKRQPVVIDQLAASKPREVSKPHEVKEQEANIKRTLKAQTLMREEKIASSHIHPCMFVDPKGHIISVAALSDLVDRLNKGDPDKIFTFEQLQRLFGQILLGAEVFHQKRFAFRDLKSDNFLIFETTDENGQTEYLLKIFDYNCITKIDTESGRLVDPNERMLCSLDYFPPEGYWTKYNEMDLLKADSYACGEILRCLLPFVQMDVIQNRLATQLVSKLKNWPHEGDETAKIWETVPDPKTGRPIPDPQFYGKRREYEKLLKNNRNLPAKRISIAQAKEDPFFSSEQITAKQFFDKLAEDFEHTIEVNGAAVDPYPSVDDPRNLFPPEIKTIYDNLTALDKEKEPSLSACNYLLIQVKTALENQKLEPFHEELKLIQADLEIQINTINDKINKLEAEIKERKVAVKKMEQELENETKFEEISAKLDALENNPDIEQKLPAYSEIIKKFSHILFYKSSERLQHTSDQLRSHLSEKKPGKLPLRDQYNDLNEQNEKLRLKLVAPQSLLETIEKAVKDFIKLNDLSVNRVVTAGSGVKKTSAVNFIQEHSELNRNNTHYTSYEKFLFFIPNPFARHGQEGFERITTLYYDLKKLLSVEASKPESNQSILAKMHGKIYQYLTSEEGNWNKFSSKTLIVKNLQEISTLDYDLWNQHFQPRMQNTYQAS